MIYFFSTLQAMHNFYKHVDKYKKCKHDFRLIFSGALILVVLKGQCISYGYLRGFS